MKEAYQRMSKVKKVRINSLPLPEHPKEYRAEDIKSLRNKLNCSQNMFAAYINVSTKTVQAWEQGCRQPNHAALRLLEIIEKGPKFLTSLIHSPSRGSPL